MQQLQGTYYMIACMLTQNKKPKTTQALILQQGFAAKNWNTTSIMSSNAHMNQQLCPTIHMTSCLPWTSLSPIHDPTSCVCPQTTFAKTPNLKPRGVVNFWN